ncbi:MAG TPA: Scr1 family TA system antitoxin-like transcriptional regulator [Trebonia sp.]
MVQVADYAAALFATEPGLTSATADAHLKARMARQQRVLNRERPPRVTVLVDELSLFRLVGSTEVMTAQMQRLAEVAATPNVTIQVVPAIAHAGVASASESLELFRELAGIWTTGVPRLTPPVAEGSA